jgi:type I site-specific restriction endonuclease
MKPPSLIEVYGEPIAVYTKEDAIADGLLIKVGKLSNNNLPVIFTTNLFNEVKQNYQEIITKGLELLNKKDPEDDGHYKLRVIEKNRILVIANTEGVTFMKPEDY